MATQRTPTERPPRPEALTIERTLTGCWTVRRGEIEVAFAMTRAAAEHERDTLTRIGLCTERRAGSRSPLAA